MPVSVRRHNLVRLRDELNLTQAALARWVGRSPLTIKSIETLRLPLSPRLAALIASVTGADKDWLLRNDLSESMPALRHGSSKREPGDEAYQTLCALLFHLFDRLFALVARLKEGPNSFRNGLELYLSASVNGLKKAGQIPDCKPGLVVPVEVFEFFKAHPELLDPDLAGWINIDFLLKDAHRVAAQVKDYDRRLAREAKVAEEFLKPRHPKAPGRSPALPSRDGRRKTEKSS
jgi:DNA-binding XRE family transcriptional regulator